MESPFKIVTEFAQLISSRNRPLQSWSFPARNIYLAAWSTKAGK